ncbi:MAG: murein hydrolase activator EnvC family protein [Legionellales bacterium]
MLPYNCCRHKSTSPYVLGLLFCIGAFAQQAPSSVAQTKTKMHELDSKISNLQKNLTSAHDQYGALNHKLASTEKQIGIGVQKLRTIKSTIDNKELKIAVLQKKANNLNQQLSAQQQLLASHIRASYQMGAYQPLKWLINQDEPYKITRILTYYQYLVKSRQQLIDDIDATQKSISKNKEILHGKLIGNQRLKVQLTQNQEQLIASKRYHSTLIQSINSDIENKQHTLKDFQKDKDRLARLLKVLSQQSVVQSSRPFTQMRKKLPLPVHSKPNAIRAMNQGLTFFADEGTVVTAVSAGKVLFSDWLKGYGLLLIIDHGQGFMTLYAHNQSLFKRKGQRVLQNEQIASVGHSGGIRQNGLYFEIRLKGKAISPRGWLSLK